MRSAGRIMNGPSPERRSTRGPVGTWVLGTGLTVGLLAAACGSESAVLEETLPSTSTTEPPAEDEAVFARIEALVRDAQSVLDQLQQDPERAEDPNDANVVELDGYHTADSPRLETIKEELGDLAEEGHHHVPREGRAFTEVVLYDTEIIEADVVEFQYCVAQDLEIRDEDDELVEPMAMLTFGDAEAHRVDGRWRIYEMEPWREIELTPGYVQARECLQYDLDEFPTRAERAEDEDEDEDDDDDEAESDGRQDDDEAGEGD